MKSKRFLVALLAMIFLLPCFAMAMSMPTDQELILVDKSLSSEDAAEIQRILGAEDSNALTLRFDLKEMLGLEEGMRAAAYYIPGDGELVIEKRTPDELEGIDTRFVAEEVRGIGLKTGTLRIASLDNVKAESLAHLDGNIGKTVLQNIDTDEIARQIKKQIPKQAGNFLDRFITYIEDEWFIITHENDDGEWLDKAKKSLKSIGLSDEKSEPEEKEMPDETAVRPEDEIPEEGQSDSESAKKNDTMDRVKSAFESVKMAVKTVVDQIWSLFQ